MRKLILNCCTALALGGLLACTSTKTASVNDLSGEWDIIAVNGATVAAPEGQETPFLAFDTANGRLTGNGSCNNMFGSFTTTADKPGSIKFDGVASTRMMCPDMKLEDEIMQALDGVVEFKPSAEGKEVNLCDASGQSLITLKKRIDAISGKMLAGAWTVVELNGQELPADTLRTFTLSFEPADSTFSCETGCNTINGNYISGYTDLKIEPTLSTRMMCDSLGNAIESTFNEVLPQVTSFGELASGNIGLYNSSNDMVMILKR